jgi:hypothetical protein
MQFCIPDLLQAGEHFGRTLYEFSNYLDQLNHDAPSPNHGRDFAQAIWEFFTARDENNK